MSKQYENIDEYIKSFPANIQQILQQIRQTIRKAAPEVVETIAYQMPTFRLNGKNLVHFAAFKNHIGFYPTPSGIESFEKELSPFVRSKGAVQFPLNKPVPYDLVEKIVNYRVQEQIIKNKKGEVKYGQAKEK
jgi:uncharacterized protein YdhG (YjbR/CyaY superfamily)